MSGPSKRQCSVGPAVAAHRSGHRQEEEQDDCNLPSPHRGLLRENTSRDLSNPELIFKFSPGRLSRFGRVKFGSVIYEVYGVVWVAGDQIESLILLISPPRIGKVTQRCDTGPPLGRLTPRRVVAPSAYPGIVLVIHSHTGDFGFLIAH